MRESSCQLFRRNVSIENLTKIFSNPRVHTGLGYYRASSNNIVDAGSKQSRLSSTDVASVLEGCGPVDDEETALMHQVQLLQEQLNECTNQLIALKNVRVVEEQKKAVAEKTAKEESERLRLQEQKKAAAEKVAREESERLRLQTQRAAEAEQARLNAIVNERKRVRNERRGNACDWLLCHNKCMPDDMTSVSCVAIGDGGYIAVKDNKSCTGHGIMSAVVEYVRKQYNENIEYIALGPDSQYYIAKTNGRIKCQGPHDFCDAVESKGVNFVSFGPWGTWYVKFKDGGSQWSEGVTDQYYGYYSDDLIPILIHESVRALFLGHNGKYFVAYGDNHEVSHAGMPSGVMKHLSDR